MWPSMRWWKTAHRTDAQGSKLSLKASSTDAPPVLNADCRTLIFKFLKSTELARFISKSVAVFGSYWQIDFRSVVEKRLPFRLTFKERVAGSWQFDFLLVDGANDVIAKIKHPRRFRDSALIDLVEEARLPANLELRHIEIMASRELLLRLTNLKTLKLDIQPNPTAATWRVPQLWPSADKLKHILSGLESLHIMSSTRTPLSADLLMDISRLRCRAIAGLLRQLEGLVELRISDVLFVVAFDERDPAVRRMTQYVFAGLETLALSPLPGIYRALPQALYLIRTSCTRISDLTLTIGEISIGQCFAAIRRLTSLKKLRLYCAKASFDKLAVSEGDYQAVSTSVTDLRIACDLRNHQGQRMLKICSCFPNAEALFLASPEIQLVQQFIAEACDRRLFSRLHSISCFIKESHHVAYNEFIKFLANATLPRILDFSQVSAFAFAYASEEPDFLTKLYRVMQTNAAFVLILHAKLHKEAAAYLKDVICWSDESESSSEHAAIVAWQQRSFGRYAGPQIQLTPGKLIIRGRKTAGTKMDEQFVIRIYSQIKPTGMVDAHNPH